MIGITALLDGKLGREAVRLHIIPRYASAVAWLGSGGWLGTGTESVHAKGIPPYWSLLTPTMMMGMSGGKSIIGTWERSPHPTENLAFRKTSYNVTCLKSGTDSGITIYNSVQIIPIRCCPTLTSIPAATFRMGELLLREVSVGHAKTVVTFDRYDF
jgi:hypothetical protein